MADTGLFVSNVETKLRHLLDEQGSILSSEEAAEVEAFRDAREYGLALETFAAILDEGDKPFSVMTFIAMEDLARQMQIADGPPLTALRAKQLSRSKQ